MSADVETLAEPFRTDVKALLADANAKSVRVGVASARRDTAEQVALRRANCGTSQSDIYEKDSMRCNPPTAKPGESQHEKGLAVDFNGDLDLVAKLAPKHNMKRTVSGERWHYEPTSARGGVTDSDLTAEQRKALDFGKGNALGVSLPNPLSPLEAGARFAVQLTKRETWLRVVGFAGGLVLVAIGLRFVIRDLGIDPLVASSAIGTETMADAPHIAEAVM